MTVYLIAELKVTDEAWLPEYVTHVHRIAARHNGRYLSRSTNVETLEGVPRDVTGIALLEFPSRDDVMALIGDPEYRPYREARRRGSICHYRLIDDTDIAGSIPYLGKPTGI
ncbi:DUF1330 domain-containing protein [Paracoccus sp. CPCC 101403]|uniref:DUF1330 domain-containing protein n=2 Tax=Paracoccus broussonetiae TaxID=3075834 RepID=A0ABU3ECQ4_9RHOB|nr:DUF1330 domain-containing protein [Paracoccus sp. CPCC 101403]MDT1061627.1 DUF1330 domain-containing protein [Paracoccus sp. CPCC 101403]